MAQSYKTIRCATFPVWGWFTLALVWGILFPAAGAQQPKKPKKIDTRQAEIFPHYEYRFAVPKDQADAVWEFLLQNFAPPEDQHYPKFTGIEEEQLTDLYFDSPDKKLLKQNLALRQRLYISSEGIKQRFQLLLPPRSGSAFGYEVAFRRNKRPDKGKAFTSHPLLKLLRKKDRALLDSLLKLNQIEINSLNTALEINQDRRQIPIVKNGNAWLLLTLTKLEVQAPQQQQIQLQIQADPEAMKQANPAVLQQLIRATDKLAQQFTAKFPELKPEKKQEYVVMAALQKIPQHQKVSPKAVFGISFVVLILAVLLYSKFRKKPLQGFD